MNLLQKLNERLKSMTKDSTFVKKLAFISMAGVMMATLAGCAEPENQDKGNENEQHNEQTIDNENDKKEEIGKPECYKDNSQILQDIVTSEYYDDLIYKAGIKQNNHYIDNRYKPIPVQYLLDNGYSNNEILNATFLDPQFYIINNKLYSFIILQRQGKDYYDEFFLSCDASEQEINDFVKLRDWNVVESSFFIQELSKKYDFNLIYSGHFASNKYQEVKEWGYKNSAGNSVTEAKKLLGISTYNEPKCNLIPLYTEPNPKATDDFIYCFVMPILDNKINLGILKYNYFMNLDTDNNQTIYKSSLDGYRGYIEDSIIEANGITFKQVNLKYALPLKEYQTKLNLDLGMYSEIDEKINF